MSESRFGSSPTSGCFLTVTLFSPLPREYNDLQLREPVGSLHVFQFCGPLEYGEAGALSLCVYLTPNHGSHTQGYMFYATFKHRAPEGGLSS